VKAGGRAGNRRKVCGRSIDMFAQWDIAFEIGVQNRLRSGNPTPLRALAGLILQFKCSPKLTTAWSETMKFRNSHCCSKDIFVTGAFSACVSCGGAICLRLLLESYHVALSFSSLASGYLLWKSNYHTIFRAPRCISSRDLACNARHYRVFPCVRSILAEGSRDWAFNC